MSKHTITPQQVFDAALYLTLKSPELRRPLPTTPARRKQRILAEGRDAILEVLRKHNPTIKDITAAIRAGYACEPDWDAINRLGAEALGIWEN
jgi:hypothetical protein